VRIGIPFGLTNGGIELNNASVALFGQLSWHVTKERSWICDDMLRCRGRISGHPQSCTRQFGGVRDDPLAAVSRCS
jgi:hypothetical protein